MAEHQVKRGDICSEGFVLRLEEFLKDWKTYGAVSTPKEVVRFMLKVSEVEKWEGLSILEPECGFYDFSRAFSSFSCFFSTSSLRFLTSLAIFSRNTGIAGLTLFSIRLYASIISISASMACLL